MPPQVDVAALEVTPSSTWGLGRGVWAGSFGVDATVVVTTTGVYTVTGSDGTPELVDSFSGAAQIGPAVLSADGTMLAVAISPSQIRRYDLETGTVFSTHDLPPTVGLRSLTIRANDRGLVADTASGPVEWTFDPLAPPRRLVAGETAGRSAWLADDTMITAMTGTNELAVISAEATELKSLSLLAGETVLDAVASPDGSVVAVSVGVGGDPFERSDSIIVLDTSTFEQLARIDTGRALDPATWSVTDDAIIATTGVLIDLWSVDGTRIGPPQEIDRSIAGIYPIDAGFITTDSGGRILSWPDDSWMPEVIDDGGVGFRSFDIWSSGESITVVDVMGRLRVLDASDGAVLRSDDRFAVGEATDVAVSSDGSRIAAASSVGRVVVLDDELSERLSFMAADVGAHVDVVAFEPVSGLLATGLAERRSDLAFDDTVSLWDTSGITQVFSLGGEAEDVPGCAFFFGRAQFSSDGTMIAVASHDFSVMIADVATGEILHALPGSATVLDLGFSPDGEILVVTHDDATLDVWDASDFTLISSSRGAMGGYFAIAILPDGDTMAAIDITGTISIIDIATGEAATTLVGPAFRSTALAMSADGAIVAAPTADAGIGFWSVSSGKLLATAYGHTANVTGLAFSPDGSWIASSSQDGTARTWNVDVFA